MWAICSCFDQASPADSIHLKDAVEPFQVQRDDPRVIAETRLDPADDARSTTIRYHRDIRRRRPIEHIYDVLLGGGTHDSVRQTPDDALEVAHDVPVGFAAPVREPVYNISR